MVTDIDSWYLSLIRLLFCRGFNVVIKYLINDIREK